MATAVQLRLDVFALRLHPDVYARLKTLAGSRWTKEGEILVTARAHRTQDANRQEARDRLAELVGKAHVRPLKRRATKPSKAAKAKRVDEKKERSAVKAGRGKVRLD